MAKHQLTGGDLRAIADALDDVERTELAHSRLLGRIEVFAPDADEPCGWIQRFDEGEPLAGWAFDALDEEVRS